MKIVVGFVFVLQVCGSVLVSLMFWSQPADLGPDPYAQMAAMIVGVPTLLLSALALRLIYKWRDALPERFRDSILLVSTAVMVVTVLDIVSGFFGVGFG